MDLKSFRKNQSSIENLGSVIESSNRRQKTDENSDIGNNSRFYIGKSYNEKFKPFRNDISQSIDSNQTPRYLPD